MIFSPLANATREIYRTVEPQDLRGPIFLAALLLLLLDSLVVLFLGGGISRLLPRLGRATAASAIIAFVMLALTANHASAQRTTKSDVPQSALETKLAYVVTGNTEVDSISKAGLAGLTLFLAQRTALEPGDPIGLDIARDELAFYPLIYWPIVPGAPRPTDAALKRIDTYMKDGGTVLFDTRDAVSAPPGPGGETKSPGMLELRKILSSLDLPELEPVSRDHVLTKTFYLLRDFPGRFNTGQLWVEALPATETRMKAADPARGGDGVSSIIITSNDLAGAWATRGRRPADAADGRRPAAPARACLPRRRQHRHVHADRQLQGRPGPCAGAARAAGPVSGDRFESRYRVRSVDQRPPALGGDRGGVSVVGAALRQRAAAALRSARWRSRWSCSRSPIRR